MAKTKIATDNAVTVKKWQEKVHREMAKKSYFARFISNPTSTKKGSEAKEGMVYVIRDLEKGQGDEVTCTFIPKLKNRARVNDQKMEGHEERLDSTTDKLRLNLYRLAVRDGGALDRKRPVFDLMKEHKHVLEQGGAEEMDLLTMEALLDNPTRTFYIDSTSEKVRSSATLAGALANIGEAESKLDSFDCFAYIKAFAANGGYDQSTGRRLQNPIKPLMVNGQPFYILLVSEDVAVSLRTSSAYEQANRDAMERGKSNPIFTGAEMVYNGVIVHTHENVPLSLRDDNVPYSQCLFMGQGAVSWAFGRRPYMTYGEFDYGNEKGYCWNLVSTVKKAKFAYGTGGQDFDFGCFSVIFSRERINDAV